MSHLLDSKPDRLAIPGHDGLWVEFKREASFTDDLVVEQQRQEILSRAPRDETSGERALDARLIAEFVFAKGVVMVTAWNLTDAAGQILSIEAASFPLLRSDVLRFIGDEAARRLLGRPVEKEAPFGKRSRRSSRPASK